MREIRYIVQETFLSDRTADGVAGGADQRAERTAGHTTDHPGSGADRPVGSGAGRKNAQQAGRSCRALRQERLQRLLDGYVQSLQERVLQGGAGQ